MKYKKYLTWFTFFAMVSFLSIGHFIFKPIEKTISYQEVSNNLKANEMLNLSLKFDLSKGTYLSLEKQNFFIPLKNEVIDINEDKVYIKPEKMKDFILSSSEIKTISNKPVYDFYLESKGIYNISPIETKFNGNGIYIKYDKTGLISGTAFMLYGFVFAWIWIMLINESWNPFSPLRIIFEFMSIFARH